MKYEPKRYRQKSSDWYGKKGMSWHGIVVTYECCDLVEASTIEANRSEDSSIYSKRIYIGTTFLKMMRIKQHLQ